MHSGCKYMVAQPLWITVQHYLVKHTPYPKPVTYTPTRGTLVCCTEVQTQGRLQYTAHDSKLLVTNVHQQKWYVHAMSSVQQCKQKKYSHTHPRDAQHHSTEGARQVGKANVHYCSIHDRDQNYAKLSYTLLQAKQVCGKSIKKQENDQYNIQTSDYFWGWGWRVGIEKDNRKLQPDW